MLSALRISNLAVIEAVEVSLGPGLTVLTGETGAGKSILVEALGLLLGGRADAEAIRAGADEASVEALFTRTSALTARLTELGLPEEADDVCVRRTICRSGRGKAFVNGSLVSAALLGRLLKGEVEVASQHEHVGLFDPAEHRALLDRSGGLQPALAAHATAFRALQAVRQRLQALGGDERALQDRLELATHHLKELQAARLEPGEDSRLEEERRRLGAAEKLRRAAAEAALHLCGDDDSAATTRIARASHLIVDASRSDASLAAMAQRLTAAQLEVDDCGRELGRYLGALAADPRKLADLDDRLDLLRRLCRKHQTDLPGLLDRQSQLGEEVQSAHQRAEVMASLQREQHQVETAATSTAAALTKARSGAAVRLSEAVSDALHRLALPRALFEVAITAGTMRIHGADDVQFLFSANAGEPVRPLQKVASGGEASRLLLALKRALASSDTCATSVMDEADAGVSGGTAEIVARMLKEVSAHRQVLCITHLPQVAAYADAHLVVHKQQKRGRTLSQVHSLSAGEERALEVARMLSGVQITPEAKGAAQALLRAARSGRSKSHERARRTA